MHGAVVGLQSEWWTMAGVHILLNRGEPECVEVSLRKKLTSHKLPHRYQCPEIQLPLSVQMSLTVGQVRYLAGRR